MMYAPLLSEVLRPRTIYDLILPESVHAKITNMISRKSITNNTFYGSPGIGKTSAARVLINELDADAYELNGSCLDQAKNALKDIKSFCSTMSLFGKPKICFIDEADFMHANVQAGLRHIIEEFSRNVRFILTANDVKKISKALQSRCNPVCFDWPITDRTEMAKDCAKWYAERLETSGYSLPQSRIERIVALHFPDMRHIANCLELDAIPPKHDAA